MTILSLLGFSVSFSPNHSQSLPPDGPALLDGPTPRWLCPQIALPPDGSAPWMAPPPALFQHTLSCLRSTSWPVLALKFTGSSSAAGSLVMVVFQETSDFHALHTVFRGTSIQCVQFLSVCQSTCRFSSRSSNC